MSNTQLEMLAVSDTQNVVQTIKEIYFEFYPSSPEFFNLETNSMNHPTLQGTKEYKETEKNYIKACEDGLFSLFMAYRIVPNFYFSQNSRICKKIS